jgi:hypothetical protein
MKVAAVTINSGLDDQGNPVPDVLLVSRSVNEDVGGIHLHITPTMSAGQTIVSLGKEDTGFILLNATSGSETPYIDIVERNRLNNRRRIGRSISIRYQSKIRRFIRNK